MRHVFILALLGAAAYGATPMNGLKLGTDANGNGQSITNLNGITATGTVCSATITGAVHASTLTIAGTALGTAAALNVGGEAGEIPRWFEAPTNAGGLVFYSDDIPGGLMVGDQTVGSFATPASVWPLAQITNAGTVAALNTGAGSGEVPVWMAIATNWDAGWVYKINDGDDAAVRTVSTADAISQGWLGTAATNDMTAGPITVCTDGTDYYVRLGNQTVAMQTNSFADAMTYAASLSNTAGFRRRIHLSSYGFGDDSTPATGIFYVDAPIVVTNTVVITGDGNPALQISPVDNYPSTNLFTVTAGNIVCFEHLRFQQQGTQTGVVTAIEFGNCTEPNLRWCEFTSFTGPSVIYRRSDNLAHHWAQVESCWFVLLGKTGIEVSYPLTNSLTIPYPLRELYVYDCKFNGLYTNAIGVSVGTNAGVVEVESCAFVAYRYNTPNFLALKAVGGQGVRVSDCTFTDFALTNSAIEIMPATAMTQGVYIVGNHAPATRNTATGGVFVSVGEYASNIVIGANSVDGFGALTDATDAQLAYETAGRVSGAFAGDGAALTNIYIGNVTWHNDNTNTVVLSGAGTPEVNQSYVWSVPLGYYEGGSYKIVWNGSTYWNVRTLAEDVLYYIEPETFPTGTWVKANGFEPVPAGALGVDTNAFADTLGLYAPTNALGTAAYRNAGTDAGNLAIYGSTNIPDRIMVTDADGNICGSTPAELLAAGGFGVGSAITNDTSDFVRSGWKTLGRPIYTYLTPSVFADGGQYWGYDVTTSPNNKRSIYADHPNVVSNRAFIGFGAHSADTNWAIKIQVYGVSRYEDGRAKGNITIVTTNLTATTAVTNHVLEWAVPENISTAAAHQIGILFSNTDLAEHMTLTNSTYIIEVQSK
jgi:hypothetical protein